MPNTKSHVVSPSIICANGDYKKVETLLETQVTHKKLKRVFIPLTPTAIRNARNKKFSENAQIRQMQKLTLTAINNGLRIVSAYDQKSALQGQRLIHGIQKGYDRSNYEIELEIARTKDFETESHEEKEKVIGKKNYFEKLAAIHGGIKKMIKLKINPHDLIITRPFYAAHIMDALRIPSKNYFGVSPYGSVPEKPREIILAEKYLKETRTKKAKTKTRPKKIKQQRFPTKARQAKNKLPKPPIHRRRP